MPQSVCMLGFTPEYFNTCDGRRTRAGYIVRGALGQWGGSRRGSLVSTSSRAVGSSKNSVTEWLFTQKSIEIWFWFLGFLWDKSYTIAGLKLVVILLPQSPQCWDWIIGASHHFHFHLYLFLKLFCLNNIWNLKCRYVCLSLCTYLCTKTSMRIN